MLLQIRKIINYHKSFRYRMSIIERCKSVKSKVCRITRLSNNAVCWVCYENGMEYDFHTSQWAKALKSHFLSGCSSLKSQPISKCHTILEWESLIFLTFINTFFHSMRKYSLFRPLINPSQKISWFMTKNKVVQNEVSLISTESMHFSSSKTL